jgi:hypothetical protein
VLFGVKSHSPDGVARVRRSWPIGSGAGLERARRRFSQTPALYLRHFLSLKLFRSIILSDMTDGT